jgi:hypothetical protein
VHDERAVVKGRGTSGDGAGSSEGAIMGFISSFMLSIALLSASPTPHGPPAPAAKPVSSDTARMNVPFAIDFFNVRVQKIEWMADTAPFAQKINASSNDGTGSLVITALVKGNSNNSASVPTPNAQAIFKDGSASTEGALDAYTVSGSKSNATYQAGDGGTVVWVLQNVAEPTSDNPTTKIVFRQSYTDLKPELIRLLSPPVTIVR